MIPYKNGRTDKIVGRENIVIPHLYVKCWWYRITRLVQTPKVLLWQKDVVFPITFL